MDTSVTIIGIILTLVIGVPIYYAINSQSINKSKIKKILAEYSANNQYDFELTPSLNKKVIAFDTANKGLLFLDFNTKTEKVSFVNLKEILHCKLVLTTEIKTETILKIEFEFTHKESSKKELIPFYSIENDQMGQVCLYQDHEMAKKWNQIIQETI